MTINIVLEQEQADAVLEAITAYIDKVPVIFGKSSGAARAAASFEIQLRQARTRIKDAISKDVDGV